MPLQENMIATEGQVFARRHAKLVTYCSVYFGVCLFAGVVSGVYGTCTNGLRYK